MAILTGDEILNRVSTGDIVISPWDEDNLNPNSYNLTLSPEIEVFAPSQILDMKKTNKGVRQLIPDSGYLLFPGTLVLGSTIEWTETYNLVPKLEGRSSIARLGLCVHLTAGFGDIGFKGQWTLEMTCVVPIRIYPLIQVCQISYETIEGAVGDRVYDGKYQNSRGHGISQLNSEFSST
jgi:dCTP deaminase